MLDYLDICNVQYERNLVHQFGHFDTSNTSSKLNPGEVVAVLHYSLTQSTNILPFFNISTPLMEAANPPVQVAKPLA